MLLGLVVLLLATILLVGYSPLLVTAQQTAAPITTTTIPPLTPEEQERQNRLQNVIAATNQNLNETEKQVGGIVYTPRWSDVVWVEPDSLAVLIAYCLPGEFAESGQEILGGFELEVLESYEIALPQGFMAWTMVIGNEDRQDRLPAAVGVICASDLNEAEARVLSPQEQQQINNVISQFTTQVTNIDQVINIINNVTTNGTIGPVTPPPPTNDTGGNDTDTGGGGGGGIVGPRVPGGGAGGIPENATAEADRTPPKIYKSTYETYGTFDPAGAVVSWRALVQDDVDGTASLYSRDGEDELSQDHIGGDIDISCNPSPSSIFPIGVTTIQCTAVDSSGNIAQASFTITLELVPPSSGGGGGTVGPRVPGGGAGVIPENATAEVDRIPPVIDVLSITTFFTDNPEGREIAYVVYAKDDVDGYVTLYGSENTRIQDAIGGDITISCDPPPGFIFPVGETTVQCTAVDQAGNVGTASFTITIELRPPPTEEAPVVEEQPPPADEEEEAPPAAAEEEVEEEEAPAAAEEDEGAAPPPANGEGGG